ncbi:MAG TPA: hypothetical protein VLX61_08300 [Anaerolineales bacterium]|nr:hypothetical protein [Anaerolineales bacterium]
MYWLRTTSIIDPVLFVLFALLWMMGGWLLVTHSGRFLKRERLMMGIASGMLLYTLLGNALGHWIPAYPAFAFAAFIVFAMGLWASRKSKIRWLDLMDLETAFQVLALIFIFGLFELIMRGLGVGDDYAHFPLVSIMAAGDIPPHYSLKPDIFLPYHYALDLFAASMVRPGGFFPWSAWDISRAFVVALTLVCGWLWIRRITHSKFGAFLGSFLLAFGMGVRWILALLPSSWMMDIASHIQLIGSSLATGNTLAEALFRPWIIDGGPPVPIPYAFANGVLNPLTFDWGGASSLPLLAIVLVLMLSGRLKLKWSGLLLLGSALLSLALSAEHVFVLINLGVGSAILIMIVCRRLSLRQLASSFWGQLIAVVIVVAVLSLVQGGVITEFARTYIERTQSVGATASGNFSLRWPPTFFDGHLGSLSFTDWRQLVVILAECGPLLLLFPIVISRLRNDFKHNRIAGLGLGIASFFGVIIPLFINYQAARDITRLTASGLTLWLLLAIQPIWRFVQRTSLWLKFITAFGYAVTIFGGIALFAYQCSAIFAPQVSTFISSMDSRMSRTYWDRLDSHFMVFDSTGYRGQTLFGRLSIDTIDGFTKSQYLPDMADPDPYVLRKSGFGYIYLDKRYWDHLSVNYQQALYPSCAHVMDRMEKMNSATGELSDFRILIDITNCQ